MLPYKDINNDSGVHSYEYGDDWIRVRFKDGKTYEYRSDKIGTRHIDQMKSLADSGNGLNAYINLNHAVRDGWSSRN